METNHITALQMGLRLDMYGVVRCMATVHAVRHLLERGEYVAAYALILSE